MEFEFGPAPVTLNNREMAVAFWLGVLILAGAIGIGLSEGISGLVRFSKLLLHPLLLVLVGLLAGYTAILAAAGTAFGLWHWGLLKETLIWFVGSALVLLFNVDKIERDPGYLRERLRRLVVWVAGMTYVANLAALPLAYELGLQPAVAGLVIASVYAERDPSRKRRARTLEFILGLIGLVLLVHGINYLVSHWAELAPIEVARSFALPIWMTLGLVPAVYTLAVVFAFEGATRHLRMFKRDRVTTSRAVLALILEGILRPHEVTKFRGYWARRLAEAPSITVARAVVRELRDQEIQRERVEQAKRERLQQFAGVDGENEFGARLDQREFEETMSALRQLSSNQMGWYRTRGNRYHLQPFDFCRSDLERDVGAAGDDMRWSLSRSGQSWWASRRTVSGWVFAIGAAGPPPDEWVFEGPDHPTSYPEGAPGWRKPWETEGTHW